jgi:cell division septal protein FtsQ
MKSRSQARPNRRYRRYETLTLAGRIETIARPSFEAMTNPRVIAGVLLTIVVGIAVWLGLDDRFYVRQIDVTGNAFTPSSEIVKSSGVAGMHIFWVNGREVEAQLLRAQPSVKKASVTCRLPAVCSINVQERTPVIAWRYGNAVTWIDADSVAFAARDAPQALKLITIEATQGPALFPGRMADPKVVQAALSVAQLMPEIRSYRYSGAHGLEFDDERGFPVYLGLGEDMSDRVMIWKALRKDLSQRSVQPKFVDIRYPLAPYYGE